LYYLQISIHITNWTAWKCTCNQTTHIL